MAVKNYYFIFKKNMHFLNGKKINIVFFAAVPVAIRVISAAFQGGVLILIARGLNVKDYGVYATACSVGVLVSSLIGLNLANYGLYVKSDNKNEISLIQSLSFYLASFIAVISFVIAFFLIGKDWGVLIAAASLYMGSEFRGGVLQSILYAKKLSWKADLSLLARRALPLFLIYGLTAWLSISMDVACVAAYGVLLICLFGGRASYSEVLVWFSDVKKNIRPFWKMGIWSMIQQLDVIVMSRFLSVEIIGAYGAAFRLASPVHIVTSVILSRWIPLISEKNLVKEKFSYGKIYIYIALLYALLVLTFSPFSIYVLPFFIGNSYEKYRYILPAPFFAASISVVNQMLSGFLFSCKRGDLVEKRVRLSVIIGIFVLCVASYFKLELLSAYSMAIGQVILIVLLLIQIKYIKRTENA